MLIDVTRRNHSFAEGEYYHCYNRGTDKRIIFQDKQDYSYFLKSLDGYNSYGTSGRLRLQKDVTGESPVSVAAYCLLPNHFHIVLRSGVENGVSKYMQRLGIGYTMYFNNKNDRTGGLFQGGFKSAHIETDQDLRQVIAYVTQNFKVHAITDEQLFRSSKDDRFGIVRDPNSDLSTTEQMEEIVQIITERRLALE